MVPDLGGKCLGSKRVADGKERFSSVRRVWFDGLGSL